MRYGIQECPQPLCVHHIFSRSLRCSMLIQSGLGIAKRNNYNRYIDVTGVDSLQV
jgi:hypothetical protein